MLEREWLQQIDAFMEENGAELTALVALSALVVGVLTVFAVPSLWTLRLTLSIVTFLSAFFTTGWIVTASASISGSATVSVEETVVESEENES